MTFPPSSPAPKGIASRFKEKLSPEQVALMRDWVEGTTWPFRAIGKELGISASTISRYAQEGGWTRPENAAPAPRIERPNPEPLRQRKPPPAPVPAGDRREQIVDKLWTLAGRHAEILETQPIERAERSLQPLARLTRTLGEMDKHARPPLPAHEYDIDAPEPRRSLHELRDELAAHLERIEREEREYDENYRWTFENGAGI